MEELPLLRNSERSSFTRCRWSWKIAYVEGLKPIQDKPALRFGTLIHKALESYYRVGVRRGPHPADTFVELYKAQEKELGSFGIYSDEKWEKAHDLGIDMLEHYVEHYGKDPTWKVLATELPFQVPVLHPRTGKPWFKSVGVVDLVVQDLESGMIGLVDHKTIATDPTVGVEYLALDDQAGTYWRYGQEAIRNAGILKRGVELNGIMFNFMRKAMRDTRPRNKEGHYLNKPTKAEILEYCSKKKISELNGVPAGKMTVADLVGALGAVADSLGEVSKTQPSPYFHRERVWRSPQDGDRVHNRVLNQYREMRMVRAGKLDAYKNPTKMNCAGCGARDLCEIDEMGQDWKPVAAATHQKWSPYGEHEIEDEGRGH